MNFYHVLQSNTSPATFPQNNASKFSTPLDNPIMLDGKWEMALMSVTHSNCIFTFNYETATLVETVGNFRYLEKPIKVYLPTPPSGERERMVNHVAASVNTFFGEDVTVSFPDPQDTRFVSWKVVAKHLFLVMSDELAKVFKGTSDVITPEDNQDINTMPLNSKIKLDKNKPFFLIAFPFAMEHRKIVLKEAQEKLDYKQLQMRHRQRIPLAPLMYSADFPRLSVLKFVENNTVIIYSPSCSSAASYNQRGKFSKGWIVSTNPFDEEIAMDEEWSCSLYQLEDIALYGSTVTHTIAMKPKLMTGPIEVVSYLEKSFRGKPITVEYIPNINHMKLQLNSQRLTLHFDDTLRDILGFDNNVFKAGTTYKSSGPISVSRRIRYFYIYSNVSDMVRIGNTEAPLLGILAFQPQSCRMVTEKTFQTPMYVPVRQNRICQIDIAIYDDAGCLIPFTQDSLTSLRVHFRKV